MSVRRTTYYSGTVQGVGFRFTSRRLAAEFVVTGTVRNLADGRVELVAEGEPEELDRFLGAVGREMSELIRDVEVNETPATNSYQGFQISF